jgi:CubicO group peptidase (beta-lactamase class C family)
MLLNHTSGLRDYIDVPREQLVRAAGRDYSNEEIVALMAAMRPLLAASPGTAFSYVNTGYVLLGAIAERAADLPVGALLADRLFRPAGLHRTSWGPPSQGDVALGYTFDGSGWLRIPYVSPSYIGASGAVWSTAQDLCSWQTALHSGGLLRPAEKTELFKPALVPNRPIPDPSESTYGLGIRRGQALGRSVFWHSGNTAGFSADSRYYPAGGISIAMLANTDAASKMAAFPRAAREAALRAASGTP